MAFLKLVLLLLAVTAWTRTDAQRPQPLGEKVTITPSGHKSSDRTLLTSVTEIHDMFTKIDTDRNQEISMREFKQTGSSLDQFFTYDRTRNYGIDELEFFTVYPISLAFDTFDTIAPAGILLRNEAPSELFEAADENGDGKVTWFEFVECMVSNAQEEFNAANALFDMLDVKNPAGVVTKDETLASVFGHDMFLAMDANRDSEITKIEIFTYIISKFPKEVTQRMNEANAAFEMVDIDEYDGVITLDEALAANIPKQHFRAMDSLGGDCDREVPKVGFVFFSKSFKDYDDEDEYRYRQMVKNTNAAFEMLDGHPYHKIQSMLQDGRYCDGLVTKIEMLNFFILNGPEEEPTYSRVESNMLFYGGNNKTVNAMDVNADYILTRVEMLLYLISNKDY